MRLPTSRLGIGRLTLLTAMFGLALCAVMCGACGYLPGSGGVSADRDLVVLVSGDTAGWIVPCGCASNQSGGLLRRGTYVATARKQAEVLVADAGGAASGTSPYDRAKFEAILDGELALGVAAHNIGAAEARFGTDYLRDVAGRLKIPFVSCNVLDAQQQPVVEPARVVTAAGRTLAFLGVLSERHAASDMQIAPPRTAILEAFDRVRQRHTIDAVVVLAYLPTDELRELAAGLPEVDLVVGGPTGQSVPPQQIGPTMLASATNKGKFLARFDQTTGSDASPARRNWRGQIVEMNATYDDDPKQQENLKRFYAELARRDFTPQQTSFATPLPPDLPKDYAIAGSESCRRCHASDCQLWAISKHAAAWKTLLTKGAHVDSYCQQCHTTGFGLPGGFQSASHAPAHAAVGCESCHGPSAGHVRDPKIHTTYVGRAASVCTTCHDHENSPTFAYPAYWPRIRHGDVKSAAGKEVGITSDLGGTP
jgi:hypothetical protein